VIQRKRCRYGDMAYLSNDIYIGKSLDLYGEYSEGEVALFQRLLEPGAVVLDIGANIGVHTVPIAQFVGPHGQVHAFEPQRIIYYLLCANVVLNNLANVICHHAAVSDRTGEIQFPEPDYTAAHNFGGLNLEKYSGSGSCSVPLIRVDDLRLTRCDLIKIDVEGMEKRVLEGAVNTLAAFRPFLYIEDDQRGKSQELRAALQNLGYEFYRHMPHYFNAHNFAGNDVNVFGFMVSANLWCRHRESASPLLPRDLGFQDGGEPFARQCVQQGIAVGAQGRLDEAEALFQQALQWQPDCADAHFYLGITREQRGRLEEAAASYLQALDIAPQRLDVLNNLGNIGNLQKMRGNVDAAMACYQAIVRLKPDFVEALYNLGVVLAERERLDEAEARYRQALHHDPHMAQASTNLGIVLARQGRFDEAVSQHQQAIRSNPDYAEAHNNLGSALAGQERVDEAIASYEQALRLKPHDPGMHFNLAHQLLLRGEFERGWREYEWRCQRGGFEPYSRWDGAPLEGRTILLHAEQGLGDTIHFLRYVPLVKQRGGIVVVECQPALLSLAATCRGIDQLVPGGAPLPVFDVHLPLTSLAGIFATCLSNIPAPIPYLSPDPARVQSWRERLAEESRFKIGIVWKGNREHKRDRDRSVPLAEFAPLARLPGVALFSLQVGEGCDQLATANLPLTDLGCCFDPLSLADLAAVLVNIDLLVSVDTAPAHLAGALGVPVWMALPLAPDWRWLLGREDTPWYPTMRLFRQRHYGEWSGVFERIAREVQRVSTL
jgi:FkbM family methyltransferase